MSAFEDKLMNEEYEKRTWWMEQYGDPIREKYGELNFTTFVYKILDDFDQCGGSLTTCDFDTHWRPFITKCGYCSVNYDYILKTESLDRDTKFLGSLSDISFTTLSR